MKITVCGLWHLGCVITACVSELFEVCGHDVSPEVVNDLQEGKVPVFESGLREALWEGRRKGRVRFSRDLAQAMEDADLVWIAYDTPVDDEDISDVCFIADRVRETFPHLTAGAIVLISSQVPLGFTREMVHSFAQSRPGVAVSFAYSPENLRLGEALHMFRNPERVVIGVQDIAAHERLRTVFGAFCDTLLWMSLESAEMTKHAINAFLAMSVTFMNDIAALCEVSGADAKDVEHGLRSDARIGEKAYLSPGGGIGGGTLGRDVQVLSSMGRRYGISTHIATSVIKSNEEHKRWLQRKLIELLGSVDGKTIAVLGLAYKPYTDTLRRSTSIEFCIWLAGEGARVVAYDPAVSELPNEMLAIVELAPSVDEALNGADALVIATAWPQFQNVSGDELIAKMRMPLVVDAKRFLDASIGDRADIKYVAFGKPTVIETEMFALRRGAKRLSATPSQGLRTFRVAGTAKPDA